MASLLSNGTSSFFPQPTSDSSKLAKGFHPKPESLKFPSPKTLNQTKIFKVRAESSVSSTDKLQKYFQNRDYDKKYGFVEDIDSYTIPKGLSEETIRLISKLKKEPEWMLEFRLKAYAKFLKMEEPKWSDNTYPLIDLQDISYYSVPKKKPTLDSLDEDEAEDNPMVLKLFDRLDVPLTKQKCSDKVAIDAVLDSESVGITNEESLEESGVIFCSISEAIRKYPDLIKKYLGRVVPSDDNYYAALNSAVFSDGSFCYVPKNTRCPLHLLSYFRMNERGTGQFERTLIVAEEESFVEYFEGCTAISNDKNQLHAAVVELYCEEGAEIEYSTVQNWYAGDEQGKGGIYNFVTKRGLCSGDRSKISWTQVEKGSAITWKYPSVVLEGDDSVGEFYSVALTNNYQQADTGTKMIHKGKNTKSRIISKGISAGHSRNSYRGLVQVHSRAENAKSTSTCDSMLIGDNAAANTYPHFQVKNPSARVEHEASTSKIGEDQLFYFQQRGIDQERALAAMISGFCRDVFNKLPNEFGSEINQLMSIKLDGSVG